MTSIWLGERTVGRSFQAPSWKISKRLKRREKKKNIRNTSFPQCSYPCCFQIYIKSRSNRPGYGKKSNQAEGLKQNPQLNSFSLPKLSFSEENTE
jgi:hypothetical protein